MAHLSGHARFSTRNWQMIAREYGRRPIRPVFDAEPCYEDHPAAFDVVNPRFSDYDVRKAAYWAVFAVHRSRIERPTSTLAPAPARSGLQQRVAVETAGPAGVSFLGRARIEAGATEPSPTKEFFSLDTTH